MKNELYRRIAADVLQSVSGLEIYTLHMRYKLSPAAIFEQIERLTRDGLVEVVGYRVKPTTFFRQEAFKNPQLLGSRSEFGTQNLPIEFVQTQLSINELYVPNASLFNKFKG